MDNAREIIETKVAGWQQYLEQLAARRRKLEQELMQIDQLTQQHIGAIHGAQELLEMLPAEDEPAPVAAQETPSVAPENAQGGGDATE